MRTYEKYLLGLCGVLVLALAPVAGPVFDEPGAQRDLGRNGGTDQASRQQASRQQPRSATTGPQEVPLAAVDRKDRPLAAGGQPASTSGASSSPSAGELLCSQASGGADPHRAWGATLAVAANEDGRFVLYGVPRSSDGRPTRDSYELLRGCSRQGERLNRAGIRIGDGPTVALGPAVVRGKTRKVGSGALVSEYRPAADLEVRQELRISTGDAGAEALEVLYAVENHSGRSREVSLSSVLAPPPAAPPRVSDGAPFVVPMLATLGGGQASDPAIREGRTLSGQQVGPVYVSRIGAASDASGLLTFGPTGPTPDGLAIAGWEDLVSGALDHRADGSALPEDSAIGVGWRGERIGPGATLVLSERYGYPPH